MTPSAIDRKSVDNDVRLGPGATAPVASSLGSVFEMLAALATALISMAGSAGRRFPSPPAPSPARRTPAAVAAKPAPAGFLNVAPQTELDPESMELIGRANVNMVRLPLFWFGVERFNPLYEVPDWSGFDAAVRAAAEEEIRVLPFVWGTPGWAAAAPTVEPVSGFARARWRGFLRRAAERYGPGGEFWAENPGLPAQPIRVWQIWNEPNIVTFSRRPNPRRHARLVRFSAGPIRTVDPGAKILLAGLFAQPLEIPPNISAARFLDRVYSVRGARASFDAAAIHPYAADASVVGPKLKSLRAAMRRNGDAGTPVWVTEMGWGSDSGESRWERGLAGQAREMRQALRLLTLNRARWRVKRVFWFSLTDAEDSCQFCDSAGLLDWGGERKPSWYEFNEWSGGDPG